MTKINRSTRITGTRVLTVPGDTLMVMKLAHESTDSRRWPAGTEYHPVSAGRDNATNADTQMVSIGGERVAFSF